jgi:cell fate (sporulation/competence/biofilm development) regulator YlbF (YheA/YmcA/DUF963 family)
MKKDNQCDKKSDHNKVYGLLGLNSKNTYQDINGCLSLLYKNSREFLQGKINEEELIPAFDNSIETLTEIWKFGYEGDTKKSGVNPEISKHYQNKYKFERLSPAKKRLQNLIDEGETHIELITDWYYLMSYLDWESTK